MGLISFLLLVVVVVVLTWLAVWAIGYFAPGHPAVVDHILWGVAIVIILVYFAQAIGLWGYDPKIPRLR